METSKIKPILGFALRSGKIVFGTDNIPVYRKRKYLILFDADLSENAKKKLILHAEPLKIPYKTVSEPLGGLLSRPGVKAVALTDPNMSKEILKYF